ncbi:hypothetical protein Mapa_018572 [Marchantia paleacea]|nr:hypothetical protein Mapa_018572 [Marchantia paleacea]
MITKGLGFSNTSPFVKGQTADKLPSSLQVVSTISIALNLLVGNSSLYSQNVLRTQLNTHSPNVLLKVFQFRRSWNGNHSLVLHPCQGQLAWSTLLLSSNFT